MTPQTDSPHSRLYGLDALRAAMMLLGIVIHTVISYVEFDVTERWFYKDTETTQVADLILLFIHSFRMPVFFVLAGFFAAMIYCRRGARGLLTNRLQRIALPFIVMLLVMSPIMKTGFVFANTAKNTSLVSAWRAAFNALTIPDTYIIDNLMHLWFLYYLFLLYLTALAFSQIITFIPVSSIIRVRHMFLVVVQRPVTRIIVLGFLTAITLIATEGVVGAPNSFIPDLFITLTYGVFFFFGWMLYLERHLLPTFQHYARRQILIATVTYLMTAILLMPSLIKGEPPIVTVLSVCLANGFCIWMFIYGLIGLFLRYFNQYSSSIRYIVDASYWIYLIHYACIIWIPGLLARSGLTVWLKMPIVIVTTFALCLATYALFVRHTLIGKVLNGHLSQQRT